MGDPTLDFLTSLDDPEKWVVVDNVPVLIPHSRDAVLSNGEKVTITVTEADLPDWLARMQALEKNGNRLPLMTIGHRDDRKGFPETQQPPFVGVYRAERVGTFGTKNTPAVLGKAYYKRETWNEAKEYPFRSVEFGPKDKTITGIALLKRDPYLEMGMVTYEKDGNMAEEKKEEKKEKVAVPDGGEKKEHGGAPEDHDKFLAHLEYAMGSHPVMKHLKAHYEAGGMVAPSGTNSLPVMPHPGDQQHMQKDESAIQYAKALETKMALHEQRVKDVESKLARKDAELIVYQLQLEGVKALDSSDAVEKMTVRLAGLTEAGRQELVKEVRANWEKDPTMAYAKAGAPVGGFIPVSEAKVESGKPEGFTQAHLDKALQYMHTKPGCTWAEAEKFAMSN